MGREIKFRAWNQHTNKWVRFNKTDDLSCYEVFGTVKLLQGNDWFWQQSTGLKDKNGVDIFEGDIVQVEDDGKRVNLAIEWAWNAYNFKTPSDYDLTNYEPDEELEVIGNIYENNELIKGESE